MVLILISVKYMGFKDKNRLPISPRSRKVTDAKKKTAPLLSKNSLPSYQDDFQASIHLSVRVAQTYTFTYTVRTACCPQSGRHASPQHPT